MYMCTLFAPQKMNKTLKKHLKLNKGVCKILK